MTRYLKNALFVILTSGLILAAAVALPSCGEPCVQCCTCSCAGDGCWTDGEVEALGDLCLDCDQECATMCSNQGCPFESAAECGLDED